jgi:hypothetical protein
VTIPLNTLPIKRSIGVIFFLTTLIGSFLWGVHYARNTPYEKILTQDERGYITTGLVKIMNDQDGVPYAIWHKDYLYTPDTAMYQLVMFK